MRVKTEKYRGLEKILFHCRKHFPDISYLVQQEMRREELEQTFKQNFRIAAFVKSLEGVPKCDDFEVCASNSDAECFKGADNNDFDNLEISKNFVKKCPSLCSICCYAKKHKEKNFVEFEEYRERIGIPSK